MLDVIDTTQSEDMDDLEFHGNFKFQAFFLEKPVIDEEILPEEFKPFTISLSENFSK